MASVTPSRRASLGLHSCPAWPATRQGWQNPTAGKPQHSPHTKVVMPGLHNGTGGGAAQPALFWWWWSWIAGVAQPACQSVDAAAHSVLFGHCVLSLKVWPRYSLPVQSPLWGPSSRHSTRNGSSPLHFERSLFVQRHGTPLD